MKTPIDNIRLSEPDPLLDKGVIPRVKSHYVE